MMKKLQLLIAIFFIATTALWAQTGNIVTMTTTETEDIYILVSYTGTGSITANGLNLANDDWTDISSIAGGDVIINATGSIQLIYLDVTETSLTQLNVSQAIYLTALNCYANQLTELDITNNTALVALDCDDNLLTELDITKCTELEELYCDFNQLTELDVANNTELTDLACAHNQLTQLDLSNNTELTYLSCEYNQLTELNVTQNEVLKYLYCYNNQLTELETNTALIELHCNDNLLTKLHLTNSTALDRLYCENNQLTELDITSNTALSWLSCYANQLSYLDLSNNPNIWLMYANFQTIEVAVSAGATTFSNPIYYHNGTEVEDVQINGTAYAYGASIDIPASNTLNFTTNNSYYGDTYSGVINIVTSNSIDSFNTLSLNLYPNPATNQVTISGIAAGDIITVSDLSGKQIMQMRATADVQNIDISTLRAGTYVLSAGNARGKLVVSY